MKNFNKKILIISLILALFSTYLVYKYLKSFEDDSKRVEYIEIYVANDNIEAREKIDSKMIKKIKVAKDTYMINSLQNIDEIIGMYAKEKILKGEVIPKERLFEHVDEDLSLRIPDGKRAVSILVNEIVGVADLIKPGDYVDTFVTVDEYRIENGNTTTIFPKTTKLILQNTLVLAVSKEQNRKDEIREETPTTYAVTVAVSIDESEKLILAEDTGRLKLALRPLHEKNTFNTNGIIRNDIIPEKGKLIISK